MERASIVWWIDHLGEGGAQKALSEIVVGLSSLIDVQAVIVLNSDVRQEHLEKLQKAGIEVKIIGRWRLLSGIGLIEIFRWLKQRRFDVAITFLFWSDVIGLLISRVLNIRKLVSCQRSNNSNYSRLKWIVVSMVFRLADFVVLNAEGYREEFISRCGFPRERVRVIKNAVAVHKYNLEPASNKLRKMIGIPSGRTIVGSVGRLSKEKGFMELISALSCLKTSEVDLVIAGSGPDKGDLQAHAKRLGLSKRVHFLGYLPDVKFIYQEFDLYIQPSMFEGMPMSVLEAMASGCPVIATDVGGMSDLITDDREGWLIKNRNPAKIAESIQCVLNNPEEASRRVEIAKNRLIRCFSIDVAINAWNTLFREIDGYDCLKSN